MRLPTQPGDHTLAGKDSVLADAPDVRTVTIPCADVSLVADCMGDDSNPPVLLLHGGGQTRHAWRSTGLRLARRGWYAVCADLRGHGESGWSANGKYHLDHFAGDVACMTHHLNQRPVLIGASLGGIASLAAIGRDPRLALGLVLVDVSPFVQLHGTTKIRDFMASQPDGFETLDEAADAVGAYLSHRPRPRQLGGLKKNLRQVGDRLFWHWDPALLRSVDDLLEERNALIDPPRLESAARSLQVPTLLVRGGMSDVLSMDDVRQFLDLVPHAEIRVISDARHMVVGDNNEVFGSVLEEFLDRRIRDTLAILNRHESSRSPGSRRHG